MDERIDFERLADGLLGRYGVRQLARWSGLHPSVISRALNLRNEMSIPNQRKLISGLEAHGVAVPFVLEARQEFVAARDEGAPDAGAMRERARLDDLRPLEALAPLAALERRYADSQPRVAARVAQSRPWKLSSLADFDGVTSETRRISQMYGSSMSRETVLELERMEAVAWSARGDFAKADRAFRRMLQTRDLSTWPHYSPPVEHFIAKNHARQATFLSGSDRRGAEAAYVRAIEFFEMSDSRVGRDPHDPRTGWNDLQRARLILGAADIAPDADRRQVSELLNSANDRLGRDGVGTHLVRLEILVRDALEGEDLGRIKRKARPVLSDLLAREHLTGAAATLVFLAWLHAQSRTVEAAQSAVEEAVTAYTLVPYEWFWIRVRDTLVDARRGFESSAQYQRFVAELEKRAAQGLGEFWVLDVRPLDERQRLSLIGKVFADVARQRAADPRAALRSM